MQNAEFQIKKIHVMKKSFAILTFLAVAVSYTQAQVVLSFKPEKGVTYRYEIDINQDMTQKMMGMEVPMTLNMGFDYDMIVKSATNQEIKMQTTFKGITYLLKSMYMNMEYDSKNPKKELSETDRIIQKLFDVLIDKTLDVTMKPDGRVTSVSGMDAIGQDMLKAVGTENTQMAEQLGAATKQQFNDNILKATFEQSFKFYPSKPLNKNDTWDVPVEMNISGMDAIVKSKYTLTDVKGTKAYVNQSSTIEAQSESSGKLSGTMTGKMVVDITSGMPESSDMVQDISGIISVNGMEMSLSIKSHIKVAVTRK
jgi:hypothetical protein